MNENDLLNMARYFGAKNIAILCYKEAKNCSHDLVKSIDWLIKWQEAIDNQNEALEKIASYKRIKGMLIAAGFTG